jgi:RimJ/RimL family protein N-acetyltransferase
MYAKKAPEQIVTQRLLIRRPIPEDAEIVFARYSSDAEVTRYVAWPKHVSSDQAKTFIAFSDSQWKEWPAGPYLVFAKDNGLLLGGTGLVFRTRKKAETGYVFAKDSWNKGYATESLYAMIELARMLKISHLYATCHIDHRASARVLEKCGFSFDKILRKNTEFPNLSPGKLLDVLCYSIKLSRVGTAGSKTRP